MIFWSPGLQKHVLIADAGVAAVDTWTWDGLKWRRLRIVWDWCEDWAWVE